MNYRNNLAESMKYFVQNEYAEKNERIDALIDAYADEVSRMMKLDDDPALKGEADCIREKAEGIRNEMESIGTEASHFAYTLMDRHIRYYPFN